MELEWSRIVSVLASGQFMPSLWSESMSIPGGMDIDVCLSAVGDSAVWQPGCLWWNEQDKSQTEAEAEVEIKSSDTSTANEFEILRTQ